MAAAGRGRGNRGAALAPTLAGSVWKPLFRHLAAGCTLRSNAGVATDPTSRLGCGDQPETELTRLVSIRSASVRPSSAGSDPHRKPGSQDLSDSALGYRRSAVHHRQSRAGARGAIRRGAAAATLSPRRTYLTLHRSRMALDHHLATVGISCHRGAPTWAQPVEA